MIREPVPPRPAPPDSPPLVSGAPELCRDQFDRLMAIAGPEHSAELLHRLTLDLESVLERLEAALPAPDWAELRAQTHILVALAGAVGARRLQYMAEAVNGLSGSGGTPMLDRLMPPLFGQLRTLIAFVSERLTEFRA